MPKTYCDLPFEHQYIHMSGSMRLCCATLENATDKNGNRYHMSNHSLDQVWNSDYMKQVRIDMKNGKVLNACSKCVGQEERGYGSMRKEIDREKNINNMNTNGSIDIMPISMELHFGNLKQ